MIIFKLSLLVLSHLLQQNQSLYCHFRLVLLEDLDDVGAELVVVTVFELAVVAQVEG